MLPSPASAQYTTQEKQDAIKAIAAYLEDVGEPEAAELWRENWKRGHYSFAPLPIETDARVVAGNTNITFNEEMIRQLRREAGPERLTIGNWAATFMHEQAHTRQWKAAWIKSDGSYLMGGPHPLEAEAWGEGFKAYWKWLLRTNAKYQSARTDEQKQKYAKEMIDLAASFRSYHSNYIRGKLGPLPADLRFEPLDGRYEAVPLKFEEAFREADRIIKKLGPTLRLAVRLNKPVFKARPGERMKFQAYPKNVWSPDRQKGAVRYTWKAGSKKLAETSSTLVRTATVDETITVIASDDRSQKAEASCQVIVRGPAMPAEPTPETSAPKAATKSPAPVPVAKTPATTPSKGEYAWVQVDERTNDWKERLDRRNVAMNGYWTHKMSVSEGSVTITNTYTGKQSSSWPKNGMSNTGTATWTPPSKTTIRSGDVVSVGLTTLNAPRDHANFGAVIFIKVETFSLGKDGKFAGRLSGFADPKGKDVLGAGSPRGHDTKAPEAMTVSHKFGAGAAEGDKMAICVTAAGESEMVQTEYIYEWKRH
ncbi:MAG: hypothetical protein LC732_02185 [Acidobacteria bacterium]|nr:hypothetical protein [Acidobacteriota bacterium]